MKSFGGPALLLNRSNINTDEIIPGQYLSELTKEALRPHCFEGLDLPGFDREGDVFKRAKVVVARENFGCGSSREQAVWALEANGILVCLAESFSRIFRQNMFNAGGLAIELAKSEIDCIFETHEPVINVDLKVKTVIVEAAGKTLDFKFSLSAFDEALVRAGGWLELASSIC